MYKFIFCLIYIELSYFWIKLYPKIGLFESKPFNCVFFTKHLLLKQTERSLFRSAKSENLRKEERKE